MARNLKQLLLFTILCLWGVSVYGQRKGVIYSYDAAGNRISRVAIVVNMQRNVTPKESAADTIPIASSLGERTIVVHPNPTQGDLVVEIRNGAEESEVTLQLFDLNSRLLLTQRKKGTFHPLNLSSYKKGIYVLRLMIGKEYLEYKIIKD